MIYIEKRLKDMNIQKKAKKQEIRLKKLCHIGRGSSLKLQVLMYRRNKWNMKRFIKSILVMIMILTVKIIHL
jgi:hypothetical protein